jgi:hypothetical protein
MDKDAKKQGIPGWFALAGIVAMAAAGICHAIWTERWARDDGHFAASLDLSRVPGSLGDWQGQEPIQEEDNGLVHYSRRYMNRATGRSVMLVLTYGKPGPVAVHTPDVCYESSGYEITRPVRFTPNLTNGGQSGEFFTSQFRKKTPTGPQVLRIFWSWYADGAWLAPDNPRLVFARYPRLLKLYLINESSAENAPAERDPCLELLPLILPASQKLLDPSNS